MATKSTKKPVAKSPAKKASKAPASGASKSAKSVSASKSAAKPAPKSAAKPAPKSAAKPAAKPATKSKVKPAAKPVKPAAKTAVKTSKANPKATAKPAAKVPAKPVAKTPAKPEGKSKAPAQPSAEKSKPPKATGKPGRKAKGEAKGMEDDADLVTDDIEEELAGDPVETTEKVKPLRMKISKAKERALMKEFGLDETVLSEEDMAKRRARLKALIKLGKTRGYLTHGEISDHLPDKLVDAETLEVVIATLNDLGVAVYEQTPDAETLIITDNAPTGSTEEEAEEAAEAALSTVDSEFGRTTDPVRMYMREMGTVELLTREGEIEIAKRIEGGLMDMMEAISEIGRAHV